MGQSWYRDGLKFDCTQCGNCCSGAPGYVWVTKEDRRAIAEFLKAPSGALDERHVRRVGFRYSLNEHRNGDCIFLKSVDGKRICGIYPVRPLQCRTWPFWHHNLRSPEAWQAAAETCPGMNRGPHHSFVAIEEVRISNRWEGAAGWLTT